MTTMNHHDTLHSNLSIVYSLSFLPTPPTPSFIHQEGRVETFGDRIERLDSLRAPPPALPPGLPPGRFAPGRGPGQTAPEPSEVPSPALGALALWAGIFGRKLKAPLAINTVEIVEDDEAEVAEIAELLSNRVLRF